MSQPYIGEIRMFGGNFAPAGWMFCEGQLLPISENDALFALIGTIYGGDGESTFALPDLRGRLPLHMGQGGGLSNRVIGQAAGTEQVTLTTQQIPAHNHPLLATNAAGNETGPGGNVLASSTQIELYADNDPDPGLLLAPATLGSRGGSQPHDNFMPYLCVNFIISLFGIFPQQN